MITYNYCCINDNCKVNGTIPIQKEESLREREESCYGCDQPLKRLGQMSNLGIRGDIATRMLRNQAHFKARAKKHSQTEDQQILKRKRQDQEFASMGLHKKK